MSRLIVIISIVAAGIIFSLIPFDCYANEAKNDVWQFSIAPYVWFLAADGDVSVRGQEAEIDESFSDLLDVTDAAYFLRFNVEKGIWSVFVDTVYSETSNDSKIDVGPLSFGVDLETEMMILDTALALKVHEQENLAIRVFAGARFWTVDLKLEGTAGPVSLPVDQEKDWTDPIVGVVLNGSINEKWDWFGRADIGGFALSSDSSNSTWNLEAAAGYNFNDWASLWFGYRALHVNYDEGRSGDKFDLDVTLHGPTLALNASF